MSRWLFALLAAGTLFFAMPARHRRSALYARALAEAALEHEDRPSTSSSSVSISAAT